ncbi:hypothetical protein [Novosphingobium malaysiense]|uniref:Uncharacterized protein n=1 Tax=Novosphingobium malaysiense TaxID=1348853 RepID=A0A0B1ZV73_9SPHN|nr:hypothetical protein [Novosphingobium malaysiense]KHK93022.1 hypothetical protein LK12_01175 [Novosphingobium malaysiense]
MERVYQVYLAYALIVGMVAVIVAIILRARFNAPRRKNARARKRDNDAYEARMAQQDADNETDPGQRN